MDTMIEIDEALLEAARELTGEIAMVAPLKQVRLALDGLNS